MEFKSRCIFTAAFLLAASSNLRLPVGQGALPRIQEGTTTNHFISIMAITNDEFCRTVMRELAEMVGEQGDPLRNRQKTGLLDALTSPSNTDGGRVDNVIDMGDGKPKKAIFKWLQPDAVSDASDGILDLCDEEGEASAYNYDEVSIDYSVSSKVHSLDEAQMRELCETGSEFRSKLIGGALNSVHKKLNQTLIAPFYVGAGGIKGGNGAKNTAYDLLYRDGLVQIDPEGQIEMMRDLMDAGVSGMPIFIGGSRLDTYMKLQQIACCNSYGADPSEQQDLLFFYDNDMQTILGTPSAAGDNFFVFQPGAAQLISIPYNKGEFRKANDLFIHDTIIDPLSGLEWDFNLKYDDCDRKYKFMISLRFGLWQIPTTLFKAGDDRRGINYNFAFLAEEVAAV